MVTVENRRVRQRNLPAVPDYGYRRGVPYRDLSRRRPRDYLAPGEKWPTGELVGDADPEAHFAQGIAWRLRAFTEGEKMRSVAERANVSPQTLYNILNGTSWGDVVTIQRLEAALEQRLWVNGELPPSVEREYPFRVRGPRDADSRVEALLPRREVTYYPNPADDEPE